MSCKTCFPHGPDDPCTCNGCWACEGNVIGCVCDINWDCEHPATDLRKIAANLETVANEVTS